MPTCAIGILYAGGYLAQFIRNYAVWQENGGSIGGGTSPARASLAFWECMSSAFQFPHGLYGILTCLVLLLILVLYILKIGQGERTVVDRERNLEFSSKGTYGTAGFMGQDEMKEVLELVPLQELKRYDGIILGKMEGKALCFPANSMLNSNMAVFGASGSKKTRAFCINRILSAVARGESLICTDPKSELYEKTSEYLKSQGYIVKVFNLVSPENSDSWNCLAEIEGQELMAQLFCDIIIRNTGSERGDHFWDNSELNLLKALVLYVEQGYPPEGRNIGQVYRLIAMGSEQELDGLFDMLPSGHVAKAPYNIFKRASESVRSSIIIGLGSRMSVFQNKQICEMTSYDEIDLELAGKQKCAYFCITSDQDSTFDFLSSLFLSFCFIKLVRYADKHCENSRLPVPVHVLGEELTAVGVIPDLSRKISVIRARNISMSCVFQNLPGFQNRYPQNIWQEILGNCDVQVFLGCTDELSAEFVSARSGIASVAVSSKAKQLHTWRISDYTPEYREVSSIGRRNILTPDEVLRFPINNELIILRGHNILQAEKFDYSTHPESKQLKACKASAYKPERDTRDAATDITLAPSGKKSSSPPSRKKRESASLDASNKQGKKEKEILSINKDSIMN